MENKHPEILWLASWYPTELDPYSGDFIQRHARAVSAFRPVHVIHFAYDPDKKVTDDVTVSKHYHPNLRETIVYYTAGKGFGGFFRKYAAYRKFRSVLKKYLKEFIGKEGKPELVHLHSAYKAGLAALWLKKKFNIRYILTEHWTYFLPEARPNIDGLPGTVKRMISRIIQQAEVVLPVSGYLAGALHSRYSEIKIQIISNTVDLNIFSPGEKNKTEELRLVHISSLSYQKDPESLFFAIAELVKNKIPVMLEVFGPVNEYSRSLVAKYSIDKEVLFHGEKPQDDLANSLQQADGLVLYSRYETFGCVLIEANACGVPVIVTDSPLMREIVKENENGLLVRPGEPMELARRLTEFYEKRYRFDRSRIAENARSAYSFQKIGDQINTVYNSILKT